MDEILRYTDLAHTIQLARAHEMNDRDIVRALTGSMSYGGSSENGTQGSAPAGNHRQRIYAAPKEQLGSFNFCDEAFAIALLQKFRLTKRLAALTGFSLHGFHQLLHRLIEQISFALDFCLLGCRHRETIQFFGGLANQKLERPPIKRELRPSI
jgi:hypothetical protein